MALVASLATTGVAHSEPPPAPAAGAAPRALDLVVSGVTLPALSAKVMRGEVQRIWAREGVAITWRTSEDDVPRGTRYVTLTIIDDVNRPMRKPASYVLGDFLADEGRIRVSLFAAVRAAHDATAPMRRPRETFAYPMALGYVLARAIAHEVGHALLGRAHTESGLMSAAFSPASMADPTSSRFRLDDASAAQLTHAAFGTRLRVKDGGQPGRRLQTATPAVSSSGGH